MAKDVKIEILYYKTSADVSLEFGLHGDYPIRLLASSCKSNTEFLKCLKRAVSRSEIIITVGGYLEDNLPLIMARAIGKKSIVPDYNSQNVLTYNRYAIPEGAVPLTAKNNYFGGFLIESGPQTIISFTEDKATRLSIVKELLVDYITEHHKTYGSGLQYIANKGADAEGAIDIESLTVAEPENTTEADAKKSVEIENEAAVETEVQIYAEPSFEIATDDADFANKTEETPVEECEAADEATVKDFETVNTDATDESHNLNENTDFDSAVKTDTRIYLDDLDDDFINVDNKNKEPCRHRKNRILRILCLIFSVIALFVTALAIWHLPPAENANAEIKDYYASVQAVYSTDTDSLSEAFSKLKELDSSIFTWLTIDEIELNHPAYSVENLDRLYVQLNSLPNGQSDARGMLLSTNNREVTDSDRNTVIFGNANHGGLLSAIASLKNGDIIKASDRHFKSEWEIISTFTADKAGSFDYAQTSFADTEEYLGYLSEIDALSDNSTNDTFYGNEQLIILVGITDKDRYVAVAKLTSIRVLMTPEYNSGIINSSSGNTPSDSSEEITSSESDTDEKNEDDDYNDFLGNTPDIILPSIPTQSTPSSSQASSGSSSNTTTIASTASEQSSSTSPSSPSSVNSSTSGNSSEQTSAEPSTPSSGTVSSVISSSPSNATSVNTSSVSSSVSASSTASSTPSATNPNIDPIYTWDVMVAVKSKGPDRKGEVIVGTAAEVVAWIIEIEMSPTIHPPEALIAQAVVKYNWIINNGGRCSYDSDGNLIVPSKPPENAMQTPTAQALQYANAAKGMVLVYGNTLAKTYCHDTSAGYTAAYHNVWGGGSYPYLQGVECEVDKDAKNYEVTTTYTSTEIKAVLEKLKKSDSAFSGIDIANTPKEQWIVPLEYDSNNAYCTKVSICGVTKNGKYLRDSVLTKTNTGKTTIRSAAYTVTYNAEADTFTVVTRGYGHGVGLSQQGAISYAKQGWTAEQILAHFFPGTTLIKN